MLLRGKRLMILRLWVLSDTQTIASATQGISKFWCDGLLVLGLRYMLRLPCLVLSMFPLRSLRNGCSSLLEEVVSIRLILQMTSQLFWLFRSERCRFMHVRSHQRLASRRAGRQMERRAQVAGGVV